MNWDWRAFSGINTELRRAADYAMQAMTLALHDQPDLADGYAQFIVKDMERAADALGYDLVKRETKQEAA